MVFALYHINGDFADCLCRSFNSWTKRLINIYQYVLNQLYQVVM